MTDKEEFKNVSVLLFGDVDEESSDEYFGDSNLTSKPIPIRNRSLSYSAPINRDAYTQISQSPATQYLSEFIAHRDDSFGLEGFNEGRVVGNYLIGPVVGGGGFGQCRQAYVINRNICAKNFPEKAALKIITDPRCFRDFEKEVTIWRRLNHPNILPLIDYCVGPNYKIAVSPLIEGSNLQELLTEKGKLTEEEAKTIFEKICQGIRYLHNECSIAHLDIKLENVLIIPATPRHSVQVFICDFGLSSCGTDDKWSKGIDNNPDEFNDLFCSGSITSLPPEVLSTNSSSNSEQHNFNSFEQKKKQDIWGLGVLLYALVCGKLPFYDQFMPRLQHSIITGCYPEPPNQLSFELKELISSLLNVNSHERPDINAILNHNWLKQGK
jgi:serine/threonine protein kinase